MTARAVKLKVFASVPKDCSFWLKMMAGTEFAMSYRSRYAEAVLRTLKPKWKSRFRRTLRVSCESILERRLPDNKRRRGKDRHGHVWARKQGFRQVRVVKSPTL
jgi:hypothetical protein